MSGTVRVQAHDLHRLLLEFRAQLERDGAPVSYRGGWVHGLDYDRSFERLADVIDAHLAASGCGPDSRTRCQPGQPVYDWPEDLGPMGWANVTSGAAAGDIGGRLRHLAAETTPGWYRTLCGFKFIDEDLAPDGTAYKRCVVCVREQHLRALADAIEETSQP